MHKNTNIIVLLNHLGGIDEADLQYIEEKFKDLPIVLKEIRSDKEYNTNFEDFSLQVFYSFSSPFLAALMHHEKGLDIWKSFKTVLTYTRNKTRYEIYSRQKMEISILKPITFGIHVVMDANTSYNFELSRILDDKLFEVSLDRILTFLSDQSPNKQYDLPFYVRYSADKKQWESESFQDYLLRKSMSN
ncbi:hypothetical protein [Chryseobacterium sp.]|uniref:hypothetical protein n=1 Tax=Chryseobacterium sp. TaxID=1871047 RepID=UPI0035AF576C